LLAAPRCPSCTGWCLSRLALGGSGGDEGLGGRTVSGLLSAFPSLSSPHHLGPLCGTLGWGGGRGAGGSARGGSGSGHCSCDRVRGSAPAVYWGWGGGADAARMRRLASSLLFSLLFSYFLLLRASDVFPFPGGGASPVLGEGGGSVCLPFLIGG